MVVQAIRSIIFYILFLLNTIILALILGTIALLKKRGRYGFGWALAKYWGYSTLFLLRYIVGIKTKIIGLENLPEGGCIIGAKHQSDWDIFALFPVIGHFSFIAKKQLLNIPFFGWAARDFDTISIDRSKGSQAIPEMNEQAKAAVERGCKIVIFPEGTRRAPLAEPNYRYGIIKMYQYLNVPIVPVALNSGLFWGRNALILWPGTAIAKILPPIPAGLKPDEAFSRLQQIVEKYSNELMLKAYNEGLSRPLTPQLREKFEKLRAASEQNPPIAKQE